MVANRTCITCSWNLGGGDCRVHLELKCAEGGYGAWQIRTTFRNVAEAAEYMDEIGYTSNYGVYKQDNGLYALRLLEEHK